MDTRKATGRKEGYNNKWTFRVNRNKDSNIKTYKARLVIKGVLKRGSLDYEETYTPVT